VKRPYLPQDDVEFIAAAIHDRLFEIFPDPTQGAHRSFDFGYTVIAIPNCKVFYKNAHLEARCWIYGEGVKPREFRCEYANPRLIELLEAKLQEWFETEITVTEQSHFRHQPVPRTNFAA